VEIDQPTINYMCTNCVKNLIHIITLEKQAVTNVKIYA